MTAAPYTTVLYTLLYIYGMARGISRIAKRGSGRHAETVMTVGRWRRGSEEALGNDAKIESIGE